MAFKSIKTYAQTRHNLTPCADRRKGGALKYLVIHYTASEAPAKNNCIYFGGGNRGASADYFIDRDGAAYKFNKDHKKWYSWHCGDGHGAYGITNANSIGVEVVSAGGDFTAAQIKTLKALIRYMRKYYGRDLKVVRHYDASRKHCPAPYAGSAAKDKKWAALLEKIDSAYKATSGTYAYKRRLFRKAYRGRKISKGDVVHIVATFQGPKYLWGKLPDGTWINLTKKFKAA